MIGNDIPAYPFKTAWDKYADGAILHLNLKLSESNTAMLPSQKVAYICWLLHENAAYDMGAESASCGSH